MRPAALYNVIAGAGWPILYGLYRLEARGLENLPASGFVLACNHVSSFDPWPLGLPLWPKRWLRFMAKSELYWFPMKLVIDGAGAFPVKRGQHDSAAMDTAVRLAREGNIVAMFPEGTRRTKGLLKTREARPRSGAARIALEAGVPLVPAAVQGTDKLRRFGKIRVAYGKPIEVGDLGELAPRDAAQTATDRLMESIYALEASF